MKLIDADELEYEDIECVNGKTYMVVHAPEIENAVPIDAIPIARIKEVRKEIASGINALDDWNTEEDAMKYAYTNCIEILDKLIEEVEKKDE